MYCTCLWKCKMLTTFSPKVYLSLIMKSHFFLSSWRKNILCLTCWKQRKDSFLIILVSGFIFIYYTYRRKRVPLLRSCISKESKFMHNSPFKNFSWPQLNHIFFSQQALMFRVILCADWLMCHWTNHCGNKGGII